MVFKKGDPFQLEQARKGGAAVPGEKRSFSQDRGLASKAGQTGGRAVPASARSFSRDRELAREAGRKGGRVTQRSNGDGDEKA